MSFTIKGFLKLKRDAEQVTDKLLVRVFVIEVPGKYTNEYAFQMINDRCELLDNIDEGTEVEVSFDIQCRPWKDKYFTNLSAWKCVPTSVVGSKAEERRKEQAKETHSAPEPSEHDDLPF